MRKLEIEAWALTVLDKVKAGQPIEDSRVEVKTGWQEASRVAREIAGHANMAHGDPVLWLIGVNEKEGVVGAEFLEFSNWFQQIRAQFNELAPEVQELNIPSADKTVVALLFETDRFPYVVKNAAFGEKDVRVKYEVPWREGQSTRTATRADLVRLLTPLLEQPRIEVLEASLGLFPDEGKEAGIKLQAFYWSLSLTLYVVPSALPLVIPLHLCSAEFEITYCVPRTAFSYLHFRAGERANVTITPSEISFGGPAMITLDATLDGNPPDRNDCLINDASIIVHLQSVYSDNPVVVADILHYKQPTREEIISSWAVRHIES